MNVPKLREAARLFDLAGDPSRVIILTRLAHGDLNVSGLTVEMGQSQPAVSHHLALLRHGRIVEPRRSGKNVFYTLTDRGQQLASVIETLFRPAPEAPTKPPKRTQED